MHMLLLITVLGAVDAVKVLTVHKYSDSYFYVNCVRDGGVWKRIENSAHTRHRPTINITIDDRVIRAVMVDDEDCKLYIRFCSISTNKYNDNGVASYYFDTCSTDFIGHRTCIYNNYICRYAIYTQNFSTCDDD